jgi:hypothetical protein
LPPDQLDLSLNEVETLAQKAARGAGLPWGVAEDAGRAAVWICRRGGDWAGALLALLETPPPDAESPLLLGGWLADAAEPCRMARVAWPLWALPGLLRTTARPVSVLLGNAELRCNPGEDPAATLAGASLAAMQEASLALAFPPGPLPMLPYPLPAIVRRARVPGAEWRRLQALAARTYVPATARSRLTGAGAGLLDDE